MFVGLDKYILGFLGEMADSSSWTEKVSENKEALKNNEVMSKRPRRQLKGIPMGKYGAN